MKKFTLRGRRRIITACMIVGILIMLPAVLFGGKVSILALVGGGVVAAALILDLALWRCPYCNHYFHFLNRENGDFCQKCGNRIYLDEPYGED